MLFSSEIPPPTAEHEQTLHRQSITRDEPGPILRDVETMLDFIGEDGVRVSATKHYIYTKRLPELNARLSRPLNAEYQRPQQKSYPYIHGLYLLLRAAGLVDLAKENHYMLKLRPPVVQSWDRLSPTEGYMSLLEAWINRADEEAIFGDRFDPLGNLNRSLRLFEDIPDRGLTPSSKDWSDLRYHPGYHNLALLDLLGFVSLEEEGTEAGEGWHVRRITRRPFGDALLRLLGWLQTQVAEEALAKREESDWFWGAPDRLILPRELMQEVLRDYFPEWKNSLELPETAFRPGVHVFKVSLDPKCWRRIAVPDRLPLDALSDGILEAFEFEDRAHLYRFTYRDAFGFEQHVNMNYEYANEPPFTDEVRIGDVPLRVGTGMTYVFDFGDRWEFDVVLERVDPEDPDQDAATLLEAEGPSPEQYPDWDEDWE